MKYAEAMSNLPKPTNGRTTYSSFGELIDRNCKLLLPEEHIADLASIEGHGKIIFDLNSIQKLGNNNAFHRIPFNSAREIQLLN